MSRNCSSRLIYLLQPPFLCTAYGTGQELFCCSQVPVYKCIGFVAPWEGFLSRSRSAAAFNCSRLPDGSYKVIRRWLLPMLGLYVSERDNTVDSNLVNPCP